MQQVKGKQVQGLRELVTVYRECKAGEMLDGSRFKRKSAVWRAVVFERKTEAMQTVVFERKRAVGFGISGHWGQMLLGRWFCAMDEAEFGMRVCAYGPEKV